MMEFIMTIIIFFIIMKFIVIFAKDYKLKKGK